MGERMGRAEGGNLWVRDKDGSTGKAKATSAIKAEVVLRLLLPFGRQVFSHFQQSRFPSRLMVTWEDRL